LHHILLSNLTAGADSRRRLCWSVAADVCVWFVRRRHATEQRDSTSQRRRTVTVRHDRSTSRDAHRLASQATHRPYEYHHTTLSTTT